MIVQAGKKIKCPACGKPMKGTENIRPPDRMVKRHFTCRNCGVNHVIYVSPIQDDDSDFVALAAIVVILMCLSVLAYSFILGGK